MEAFLRRQKPQTPDFLQENQGFAFYQFGGEGEIRTPGTLEYPSALAINFYGRSCFFSLAKPCLMWPAFSPSV